MDSITAGPYVPRLVTEWRDRLVKDLGGTADIEQTADRTWVLSVATDRVRVTFDFVLENRKARRRGSTLAVDGVPRTLARDYDHLKLIFADPDNEGRGTAEPLPYLPDRPVEEACSAIQVTYKNLTTSGLDVHVGEKDGHWLLGFDTPDRSLRMGFEKRRNRWGVAFIQVIIEGVDRSREVRGGLEEAITLMFGINPTPAEPLPPGVGAPAKSGRSNSVETRRATVIRT